MYDKLKMSDTSANRNVEESHNSGPDTSIANENYLPQDGSDSQHETNSPSDDYTTKMANINEKLNLTPEEEAFHQQCDREVGPPPEHTAAGRLKLQIPGEGTIPPLDNLPAFEQPLDQGARAGAGTSTPIQVPLESAARKMSR